MRVIVLTLLVVIFSSCLKELDTDYELNIYDPDYEGEWFKFVEHRVDTVLVAGISKIPLHEIDYEITHPTLLENTNNFYIESYAGIQTYGNPIKKLNGKVIFTIWRKTWQTDLCWDIEIRQKDVKDAAGKSTVCFNF